MTVIDTGNKENIEKKLKRQSTQSTNEEKKTHLQVEHHKISSELVSRKKVCDPMDFRPDWSTTDAVQVIDMTTGRAIKEKNIYTSSMPRYWESFWFNQWYNNFDKSKKLGLWGRISK